MREQGATVRNHSMRSPSIARIGGRRKDASLDWVHAERASYHDAKSSHPQDGATCMSESGPYGGGGAVKLRFELCTAIVLISL